MSARNYCGWPLLNAVILSLNVYESAAAVLRRILILMMPHSFTSSVTASISGIGGGSIRACTSVLSQTGFVWIFMVVYLEGLGEL